LTPVATAARRVDGECSCSDNSNSRVMLIFLPFP
jgi:hypothetical protein